MTKSARSLKTGVLSAGCPFMMSQRPNICGPREDLSPSLRGSIVCFTIAGKKYFGIGMKRLNSRAISFGLTQNDAKPSCSLGHLLVINRYFELMRRGLKRFVDFERGLKR